MKKLFSTVLMALGLLLPGTGAAQTKGENTMDLTKQAYEFGQFGSTYIVRINPGQKLIASLLQFCRQQNIGLAEISGVGSLKSATLGFFDPESKQYVEQIITEPLELASLIGNVTLMDGEVIIHPHAVIAGADYAAKAGHLVEAEVSLTAEVIISRIDGSVNKIFNDKLGLKLMNFSK